MLVLSKIFATFFGIGYFPAAPGTIATAAGVLIAFFCAPDSFLYGAILLSCISLGIGTSTYLEKVLKVKDPGIIVIDEVAGIMLALAGMPLTMGVMISGFFLFRAFDMFKIYPINKIENLPGGWGIICDDLMAGIYTNIILQIALRWAGII